MEKKQTAVEWLVNQLDKNFILDQILNNDYTVDTLIGQAKEMEKQQIIEAAERWKGTNFAEQYYNETYGNER